MLRKIEGTVQTYKPIGVRRVQFEIQGTDRLIELNVDQPWVLKGGDYVVVAGEDNGRSGNNRNIGKVKDVPSETVRMKAEKVGDRAVHEPVDGIAGGAPHDRAKRQCREAVMGMGEP